MVKLSVSIVTAMDTVPYLNVDVTLLVTVG